MGRYLVRRLGFALLLIFIVSSAALLLTKIAPGDFAGAQGLDLTAEQREQIRINLGLNRSPAAQYFSWLGGVSHFDFRSNTPEPSILTDYWLLQTTDGVNWHESRIAATFDYATAPNARGLFLGDYMGLVSSGTTFVPVYATTTGDLMNRTDVFATLQSTVGASAAAAASAAFRSGPAADPMVPTPALAKAFSDAAARVIERRRGIGQADATTR